MSRKGTKKFIEDLLEEINTGCDEGIFHDCSSNDYYDENDLPINYSQPHVRKFLEKLEECKVKKALDGIKNNIVFQVTNGNLKNRRFYKRH